MPNYKLTKGKQYKIFFAADMQEAQTKALPFGSGWSLAETNEPVPSEPIDSKINDVFDFGEYLIRLFRADNRQYEIDNNVTITQEETLVLMTKFKDIINLCIVGAIKEIAPILPTVITDNIFTEERKAKYQALINEFLGI